METLFNMLIRFTVALCFICSAISFYFGLTSSSKGYLNSHMEVYTEIGNLDPVLDANNFIDHAYITGQPMLDSLKDNSELKKIDWLYSQRLSNYEKNISSLNSTLEGVIVLGVLGLLVLFYRPDGIPVPFISLTIPQNLIYLFVIFGSVYLWSHLGLLTNAAIDSRLVLHVMTERIENFSDAHINYLFSNSHVLVDSGFIDNWTSFFYDIFHRNTNKGDSSTYILGIFGLYGVYGTFFGLFYAVSFGTAIDFIKRKSQGRGLAYVIFGFALLVFVIANIAWGTKFAHTLTFAGWYWFVAGVCLILWAWKGESIANELSKKAKG